MEKAEGAFLTIGELARELGVAQHILRCWETRFPQLRPLQRSGNRRYYRPRDVEIARRIHQLLNVQGFTVKGAVKALSERATVASAPAAPQPAAEPAAPQQACETGQLIDRLRNIRAELAQAVNQAG
jgi:DNA-binding transcriptional MerR regulator